MKVSIALSLLLLAGCTHDDGPDPRITPGNPDYIGLIPLCEEGELPVIVASTGKPSCRAAVGKSSVVSESVAGNDASTAWQVVALDVEAAKLQQALDTVNTLLSSKQLWRDFEVVADDYAEIFIGPDYQQQGKPAGIADRNGARAFLQNSTGQFHRFKAIVGLTGTYYHQDVDYLGECRNPAGKTITCRGTAFRQNYSNMLAVTHGINLNLSSGRELVSIEIGREIFDRYNSNSINRKSCTFNTLAHEWTHTIGKDQPSHWAITVDTDVNKPAGVPFLSQLMGSVAQCSWLKSQGSIGKDDRALKSCVQKFGVEQFQSSFCV